jgi:probable F420-dependent oxidoreductase
MMQFGLSLPHFWQVASPVAIRRVAQRAEQLGYEGIWVSDHIVIPDSAVDRFGSVFYEPLTVLGFAAACTSRIRLGTTVIIVPYRNPLVTAKVLSTLDVLSGGRVTAGLGVGWTEDEFKALGVPFKERGALSDEYIAVFKALWTQDKPTFRGQYMHFDNIAFEPKPVQKPHIPMWIGGNSKRAIRRAVALGDGWHPTRPLVGDVKAGLAYLREVCPAWAGPALPDDRRTPTAQVLRRCRCLGEAASAPREHAKNHRRPRSIPRCRGAIRHARYLL